MKNILQKTIVVYKVASVAKNNNSMVIVRSRFA